ncbi:hypothetical protein Enr13x_54770 [Stieleria neptunia]|uniref:Uncharacterized protein n=2 Tax=Stieleria neptunia TaxID=2527979 RepID=A0A518HXL0_9BACT|nr:hypothetical protein Enr13x_54770 [Stieleria neptunia]
MIGNCGAASETDDIQVSMIEVVQSGLESRCTTFAINFSPSNSVRWIYNSDTSAQESLTNTLSFPFATAKVYYSTLLHSVRQTRFAEGKLLLVPGANSEIDYTGIHKVTSVTIAVFRIGNKIEDIIPIERSRLIEAFGPNEKIKPILHDVARRHRQKFTGLAWFLSSRHFESSLPLGFDPDDNESTKADDSGPSKSKGAESNSLVE